VRWAAAFVAVPRWAAAFALATLSWGVQLRRLVLRRAASIYQMYHVKGFGSTPKPFSVGCSFLCGWDAALLISTCLIC
jgi:hypothetical protein